MCERNFIFAIFILRYFENVISVIFHYYYSSVFRDKKGWTQRVGLANVSPKGLYHGIRGWFKLDSGR